MQHQSGEPAFGREMDLEAEIRAYRMLSIVGVVIEPINDYVKLRRKTTQIMSELRSCRYTDSSLYQRKKRSLARTLQARKDLLAFTRSDRFRSLCRNSGLDPEYIAMKISSAKEHVKLTDLTV